MYFTFKGKFGGNKSCSLPKNHLGERVPLIIVCVGILLGNVFISWLLIVLNVFILTVSVQYYKNNFCICICNLRNFYPCRFSSDCTFWGSCSSQPHATPRLTFLHFTRRWPLCVLVSIKEAVSEAVSGFLKAKFENRILISFFWCQNWGYCEALVCKFNLEMSDWKRLL